MFINTSNVFYDKKSDSYAYYDTDSYDVYNQCRNALSLLLKLDVFVASAYLIVRLE